MNHARHGIRAAAAHADHLDARACSRLLLASRISSRSKLASSNPSVPCCLAVFTAPSRSWLSLPQNPPQQAHRLAFQFSLHLQFRRVHRQTRRRGPRRVVQLLRPVLEFPPAARCDLAVAASLPRCRTCPPAARRRRPAPRRPAATAPCPPAPVRARTMLEQLAGARFQNLGSACRAAARGMRIAGDVTSTRLLSRVTRPSRCRIRPYQRAPLRS